MYTKEQMEAKELEVSYWRTMSAKNQETLRDKYAMAAMQGYLANPGLHHTVDADQFARNCYIYADSMIEQRDISRDSGHSD
jgi:hypothetical protein